MPGNYTLGKFVTHGCRSGKCRYTTLPSDMGTPYLRCSACGGPWGEATPRVPTLQNTPTAAMAAGERKPTRSRR